MKKIKKFRYTKSLLSQFRNIWGISKFFYLKSASLIKKKLRKSSFFSETLNSKKIIKIFYLNLSEKRLKKMFLRCKLSPFYSIDKFISLLESRIDSVLYRSCLFSSPKQSRFYISHKFILVNGKVIKRCNLILNRYDVIEFSTKFFLTSCHLQSVKTFFSQNVLLRPISSHIEIDFCSLQIIFLWDPRLTDCHFPVDMEINNLLRFYP